MNKKAIIINRFLYFGMLYVGSIKGGQYSFWKEMKYTLKPGTVLYMCWLANYNNYTHACAYIYIYKKCMHIYKKLISCKDICACAYSSSLKNNEFWTFRSIYIQTLKKPVHSQQWLKGFFIKMTTQNMFWKKILVALNIIYFQ